jgi:DNA-binding response OmpR family regulator
MSKILIIEDEPDTSKVLGKRLTNAGFSVVIATDAYEGVALAHKENPDLILLDLMLPVGGGFAVLKNLSAAFRLSLIPVIVLTGMKDNDMKEKALSMGVAEYMEKPYDPENLIVTIKKLLVK